MNLGLKGVAFLCALLSALPVGYADDQTIRPLPFREGYVRELMESNRSEPEINLQPESSVPTQRIEQFENDEPIDLKSSVSLDAAHHDKLLEEKAGVKVRSVGAIFALSSRSDLDRDVKTISALADQLSVGIGNVFFVLSGATFPDLSRETLEPLGRRGASPRVRLSPPAEYRSVKSAPAWIISTEKGDVLLEGSEHPERFFNSRGEFVEPES